MSVSDCDRKGYTHQVSYQYWNEFKGILSFSQNQSYANGLNQTASEPPLADPHEEWCGEG